MERRDVRLDAWLAALWLGGLAYYVLTYLTHPALPRASAKHPIGWWGWWDQGKYLRSAVAFSEGDLGSAGHWYPYGYSLLGAPFVGLSADHPFIVPNMLVVAGVIAVLYGLFARFGSRVEAFAVVAFALFAVEMQLASLVVPWNTIPTQLLTYAVIAVLVVGETDQRRFLLAGVLTGLIFLCRPSDFLFVMPVFLAAALHRGGFREVRSAAPVAIAGFLPFVVVLVALNYQIHGVLWRTPYEQVASGIGFTASNVWWKAWFLGFDSESVYLSSRAPLLSRAPWLMAVLPGFAMAVRAFDRRFWGVGAGMVLCWALYLSFDDMDPGNFFRFHLYHYIAWTLPLAAWFAWLSVTHAWRVLSPRLYWPLLLGPAAMTAVVGLEVRPMADVRVASAGTVVPALSDLDYGTSAVLSDGVATVGPAPEGFQVLLVAPVPEGDALSFRLDGEPMRVTRDYKVFGSGRFRMVTFHEDVVGALDVSLKSGTGAPWTVDEIHPMRVVPTAASGWLSRWLDVEPVGKARLESVGRDLAARSSDCSSGADGRKDTVVRLEVGPTAAQALHTVVVRGEGAMWVDCRSSQGGKWRLRASSPARPWEVLDGYAGERELLLHLPSGGATLAASTLSVEGFDGLGRALFALPIEEAEGPRLRARRRTDAEEVTWVERCDGEGGDIDTLLDLWLPEAYARFVTAIEVRTTDPTPGHWVGCRSERDRWRLAIGRVDGQAGLQAGGTLVVGLHDNGAWRSGASAVLVGLAEDGGEVFRVGVGPGQP